MFVATRVSSSLGCDVLNCFSFQPGKFSTRKSTSGSTSHRSKSRRSRRDRRTIDHNIPKQLVLSNYDDVSAIGDLEVPATTMSTYEYLCSSESTGLTNSILDKSSSSIFNKRDYLSTSMDSTLNVSSSSASDETCKDKYVTDSYRGEDKYACYANNFVSKTDKKKSTKKLTAGKHIESTSSPEMLDQSLEAFQSRTMATDTPKQTSKWIDCKSNIDGNVTSNVYKHHITCSRNNFQIEQKSPKDNLCTEIIPSRFFNEDSLKRHDEIRESNHPSIAQTSKQNTFPHVIVKINENLFNHQNLLVVKFVTPFDLIPGCTVKAHVDGEDIRATVVS